MRGIIYEDDIGTAIDIDMQENISGATEVSLIVRKPDHTMGVWLPQVVGSRILRYIIQAGDLQAGITLIQPQLTLGGWSGRGEIAMLFVQRSLG